MVGSNERKLITSEDHFIYVGYESVEAAPVRICIIGDRSGGDAYLTVKEAEELVKMLREKIEEAKRAE